MIRNRLILTGLALVLMSACQSTASDTASAPSSTRTSASAAVPESGLGPQELAPGECGLFLWSKTDSARFIFFNRAGSGQALFKYQDETLMLEQVTAGGTIFGQFNTQQGYQASAGQSVELAFEPGERMDGGQRIEDGLMTITDAEGWRTKLPVLGIRACLAE